MAIANYNNPVDIPAVCQIKRMAMADFALQYNQIIINSLQLQEKRRQEMKKQMNMLLTALTLSLAMVIPSYAQGWENDTVGWSWQNADGTYYTNGWQWIDGNSDGIAECYYFDSNGYMLSDTTTPDGYEVNANGAWFVNGVIQTTIIDKQAPQTNFPIINGLYFDTNWNDIYYLNTLDDGSLQVLLSDANGTKGDVYMTMAYQGNHTWSDGSDPILANRAWVTENGIHISMYGYMQRDLVETTICAR